mmetsp:Transcript_28499/g.65185  ORF Transcript_28499/g.65185 Transcript_28499/m.65185 type:complete len:224 (-) Transcript_28499:1906-2577(-)
MLIAYKQEFNMKPSRIFLMASMCLLTSRQLFAEETISVFCPTLLADFTRRQKLDWNITSGLPFPETDMSEIDMHIPMIIFGAYGSGEAAVMVGGGGGAPFHPIIASDDPKTVKFITHVYVMDQNKRVVAMRRTHPEIDEMPVELNFKIPVGTTELTPYAFSNDQGWWKGKTYDQIETTGLISSYTCGPQDYIKASSSIIADYHRQQSLPPFNMEYPYTFENGA